MAFTPITVTGKYLLPGGSACSGSVTFVLTAPMNDSADGQIRQPIPLACTLDATGSLVDPVTGVAPVLAANDDSTTAPTGVGYRVEERIAGAPMRLFTIILPHTASGGTVDLSALAPTSLSNPVYVTFDATQIQGKAVAATAPTDGQLLTYDGTAGQWKPATGAYGPPGDAIAPPGSWLFTPAISGTSSNFVDGDGAMRVTPLWVPRNVAVSAIGFTINTGGTAGAVVRTGIYNSTATQMPGTLVVDAGTVPATAAGNIQVALSPTVALTAGLYYVALVPQGAPATGPGMTYIDCGIGPGGSGTWNVGSQSSGGLAVIGGITGALPTAPAWTLHSGGGQQPWLLGLEIN